MAKPELETIFIHDPLGDASFLQIDRRTNELYWNREKLVTERRLSTFERVLAVAGVVLAAVGVAATCVQAWFAAFPPHLPWA